MRLLCAALLLVALAPRPVAAEDDPALAEAKQHFQEAEKLFAEADFDGAVSQYLAAYHAKPHPNVLYNIALAYERVYKPDDARKYYRQFLDESHGASPDLEAKATARLKVLDSLPGTIFVTASPPDARVTLGSRGGRDVRDHVGEKGVKFDELPPGEYSVRVELPEHVPFESALTLAPGEHAVLPVRLEHQREMLSIYSRPDGARVFLDGIEQGRTPLSHPVETGKRRHLRVEAQDFPPHDEMVDLQAGKPVERRIVFKRPFRSGRTELVLGAMAYGGFAGSALAQAVGVGSDNLPILLLSGVGGIGIGFLASWLLTNDDSYVRVGHSSMISGATAWGTIFGASLGLGLQLHDQTIWGTTLLGGSIGIGAGVLLARWADPSAGDAAIVNSGGMWGAVAGALLTEAIGFDSGSRSMWLGWLSMAGCGAGLLAGTLATFWVEIDRGHVAVIDVGGVAGLALAFGIGWGTETDSRKQLQTGATYGLGGMALGLILATLLSRTYKDELPQSLMARDEHGDWKLGLPSVRIATNPPFAPPETRVTLDIFSGRF